MELGNHDSDAKGEAQVGTTHERESSNAESWGGVVSSSNASCVMELGRRGHIFKLMGSKNWETRRYA